ncbi:hypothetical protein DFJ74DRAFT_656051 [Hyaloraphidium curvatum]|nr:hypothetical protein DFJ74DRAFT_656051 [Hyaloraphidium curvatum]
MSRELVLGMPPSRVFRDPSALLGNTLPMTPTEPTFSNRFPKKTTTMNDRTDSESNLPELLLRRRRPGAAALLRAAAAAVLATLLALPAPAAATSHTDSSDVEVIDPATGFFVCRHTTSGSYGSYRASQCIGWCDSGTGHSVSRRRLASRSQWGFTCGKYNGTDSCVRVPSLGCKWVLASAGMARRDHVPVRGELCRPGERDLQPVFGPLLHGGRERVTRRRRRCPMQRKERPTQRNAGHTVGRELQLLQRGLQLPPVPQETGFVPRRDRDLEQRDLPRATDGDSVV